MPDLRAQTSLYKALLDGLALNEGWEDVAADAFTNAATNAAKNLAPGTLVAENLMEAWQDVNADGTPVDASRRASGADFLVRYGTHFTSSLGKTIRNVGDAFEMTAQEALNPDDVDAKYDDPHIPNLVEPTIDDFRAMSATVLPGQWEDLKSMGQFISSAGQQAADIRTEYERVRGGASPAMKRLMSSVDMSDAWNNFKADPAAIIYDMAPDAVGTIVEFMTGVRAGMAAAPGAPLAGGASGAYLTSLFTNYGHNVEESMAHGKPFDLAMSDGWTKTTIDALGDAIPLGIARMELVKRAVYKATINRMAQFMVGTGAQLAAVTGSRKLVSEEMNPGQLFLTFGMSALQIPTELAAARRMLKGDAVAKMPPDATVYSGNVEEVSAAFVGHYLDLAAESKAASLLLDQGAKLLESDPDLNFGDQAKKETMQSFHPDPDERMRETLPFAFASVNPMKAKQAVIDSPVDKVAITHNDSGKAPSTQVYLKGDFTGKVDKQYRWQQGKVAMAWDIVGPTKEMLDGVRGSIDFIKKQMAQNGENSTNAPGLQKMLDAKELELGIMENRVAIAESVRSEIHDTVKRIYKTLAPKESVVITNASRMHPTQDVGVSMSFAKDALGELPMQHIIAINERAFWALRELPTNDGVVRKVPFFDKAGFESVVAHEVGHNVLTRKLLTEDTKTAAQMFQAFREHGDVFAKRPLREYLESTMPRALYQNLRSAVSSRTLDKTMESFYHGGQNEAYADYIYSFPEWLANQFAKTILDGPATQNIKGLEPLTERYRSHMEEAIRAAKPTIPASKLTMEGFIRKTAADVALRNETLKQLLGERRWSVIRPETFSQIWSKIPADYMATPEHLAAMFKDTTLPRSERMALARVVRSHKLDKLDPGTKVDMQSFARDFDAALKFEMDYEKNYAGLNRILKLFVDKPTDWKGFEDTTFFSGVTYRLGQWELNPSRVLSAFLTLTELGRRNPLVRPLQEFVTDFRKMNTGRTRQLQAGDDLIKEALQFGIKERTNISDFLHDLSTGEVDSVRKQLMAGGNQAPTYRDVAMKAYGISGKGYDLSRKITRLFQTNLIELRQAELERIVRRAGKGELTADLAAQLTKSITAKYGALLNKPYFPHMRFGQYTLSIRANKALDYDGRHFEPDELVLYTQFESASQRDHAMRQFGQQFGQGAVRIVGDKKPKAFAKMTELPYYMLEAIKEDADIALTPEQRRDLEDVVRRYASEGSFAKRMMKRTGTLGSSNDLIRTIAASQEAFANHYSRIVYKSQLKEHVNALDREITDEMRGANDLSLSGAKKRRSGMRVVQDAMTEFLEASFQPDARFFDQLKTFGFVMNLGWNVKSAFVNLTQLPMFAFPELAHQFGSHERAAHHLSRAMQDITAHYIRKKSPLSPDEVMTRERLRVSGVLNQSLAREMVTLASNGAFDPVSGSRTRRALHGLLESSAWLFQGTELYNREVTALATHRLLKEAGVTDQEKVFQYARSTIERTMFEYGKWNRPKIMRGFKWDGGLTSTLLLFKQFQLNALYYLSRKSPAALGTAGMLLASAGIMGLPFAEDAADVVDTVVNASQQLVKDHAPEYWDTRVKLRELMGEFNLNSDLMMHGAGRYGFGVPQLLTAAFNDNSGPEVDLSSSLTMGRIIPFGIPQMLKGLATRGLDKNAFVAQGTENIGGAVGATLGRYIEAFESGDDIWKRTEKILPVAAARLSSAIRLGSRGYETSPSGVEVMKWDVSDAKQSTELVAMALGFTPTALSQQAEIVRTKLDHIAYWEVSRDVLMRQYAFQYGAGIESAEPNREGLQRTMEEITRFNEVAPPEYVIRAQSLRTSIRNRMKTQALVEMGHVTGNRRDSVSGSIDEAFQRNTSNQDPGVVTTVYDTR